MRPAVLLCSAFAVLLPAIVLAIPVRVFNDGTVPVYPLLNRTLGGTGTGVEVPDCGHHNFTVNGELVYQHITNHYDAELGRNVFAFHIHIDYDDDRCLPEIIDRQRNEIKTYELSPEYTKLYFNETGQYSWNFKLPKGIQVTPEFGHIHQLKFIGGNDSMPLITLSLEINHQGRRVIRYVYWPENTRPARIDLVEKPIEDFEDTWLHVYERIAMRPDGEIQFEITRMADQKRLISFSSKKIHTWRWDTNFIRPKWGIYRSILYKHLLRDEIVYFDRICIAKEERVEDFCDFGGWCENCRLPAILPPDGSAASPSLAHHGGALAAPLCAAAVAIWQMSRQ